MSIPHPRSYARDYFICPIDGCGWQAGWSYLPPAPDPDMGLVIADHMEACHPETVYGAIIPASVLTKVLAMARAR